MPDAQRDTDEPSVTATTPLPDGWTAFCSRPDAAHHARWYATAPYDACALTEAECLSQTVDAAPWQELHRTVAEELARYRALTGRPR